MRYWSLQHASFETPGLLIDVIRSRGGSLRSTALYAGEALPAIGDFDVLILMGGPMSIHDEAEYPWLKPEKELVAAAIREGKQVLGICLGAQLIAAACGAKVYTNAVKEIGFWPVKWLADAVDDAFGKASASLELRSAASPRETRSFQPREARFTQPREAQFTQPRENQFTRPRETRFFHWHGETFDLPAGAVLLASTVACTNQAFRIGDQVLGVQFHPEVTPEMVKQMVEHGQWELVEAPYIQAAGDILGETPRKGAMDFLTDWL